MNTLSISVRVTATDDKSVTVIPLDAMQDCPRCQAGQGCGNVPWFGGLFSSEKSLQLGQTTPPMYLGCDAVLSLPLHILNKISLLTYFLPLMVFIMMLIATQQIPSELWQCFLAVLGMAVAFIVGHSYSNLLLRRALILTPINPINVAPVRMYCVQRDASDVSTIYNEL